MKKVLSVVLAVVFVLSLAGLAFAGDEKKGLISTDLELSYVTKYVCGMSGYTAHDHGALQGTATFTHNPTGIYLILFGSTGFKGVNTDGATEIDETLGKEWDLGGVTLTAEISHFNLVDVNHYKGDLLAFYLNIDLWKVYGFQPYVSIEFDKGTDEDILEGGVLHRIGVKREFAIAGQAFNGNLAFGGHDGAYGYKPQVLAWGRATVDTSFPIDLIDAELKLELNGQKSSSQGNIAQNEIWGGATLAWSF